MISPNFDDFKKIAKKGNLVAVVETFPADLETPVSSFLKISKNSKYAFLLESAEQTEKIGRFSFLGINPAAVYSATNDGVTVIENSKKNVLKNKKILSVLNNELAARKLANPEAFPGLPGGFIGYLSYENVQDFEKIKLTPKKDVGFPLSIFFRAEDFVVFDHFRKTLSVVVLADLKKNKSEKSAYAKTLQRMSNYKTLLKRPIEIPKPTKKIAPKKITSNMTRNEYESKVRRIKKYINAGDCIQVVLSQRFQFEHEGDDFQIYRALRSINPSPYMFYFRSGDHRLIGASPELLVKKTGRLAEVRPIAGTRPRGADEQKDLQREKQLKSSVKEMAEHLMLVDLGRNDLGRVSEFKTVKVNGFAFVERYSHVMHLVSRVQGILKKEKSTMDLLCSTFPAGTLSGAPKIRAMQIIDELEPEARGPYGGCFGYFDYNGDMDMCITIRTLMLHKNKVFLQAGAGIVSDSNPEKEYIETVNKSRALLKAMEERFLF